jgi:hypothetical protein
MKNATVNFVRPVTIYDVEGMSREEIIDLAVEMANNAEVEDLDVDLSMVPPGESGVDYFEEEEDEDNDDDNNTVSE